MAKRLVLRGGHVLAMDPVRLCADVSNIDTVIIDGKVQKREGRLVADVERARRLVEDSRDHLVSTVDRKADWTALEAV